MTNEAATIVITTLLVCTVAVLAANRRTITPPQQVHISVPTQETNTRGSMATIILLGMNIILLILYFGPTIS